LGQAEGSRTGGGVALAHKQERKELKKPDEFQVVAGKTME
jgi:hypothetical protein